METQLNYFKSSLLLFATMIICSCNTSKSNEIENAGILNPESTSSDSSKGHQEQNQHATEKCFFANLSNQFDFKINSKDKNIFEVIIYSKAQNEIVQSINADYNLSDCSVRSYVTGFQKDNEIMDEDYGDLIIDDFNFDTLDDIAIKSDFGNSGAFYKFYLQTKGNKFSLDKFLTEEVSHYPSFDKKKKAIKIATMVGASNINERYFKYSSNGWVVVLDTITEIDLQQRK